MIVPLGLLLMSGAACVVAVMLPGAADLLLLAVPAALAGLILLGHAWWRGRAPEPAAPRMRGVRFKRLASGRYILIDGSNVLHWRDNTPSIHTLREVVEAVTRRGYTPAVVFDANAGYRVSGKYMHDKALADLLALPEDRVMVMQKGAPADPMLLGAARDLGARIVTNDRYRDWAEQYPEVHTPGFLVRGSYPGGMLRLDMDELAVA